MIYLDIWGLTWIFLLGTLAGVFFLFLVDKRSSSCDVYKNDDWTNEAEGIFDRTF